MFLYLKWYVFTRMWVLFFQQYAKNRVRVSIEAEGVPAHNVELLVRLKSRSFTELTQWLLLPMLGECIAMFLLVLALASLFFGG